ncbi:SLC17A5 [Mytilus coruscus]|uniref:Sialin n=1 Tax=Mytilus coruscus TaxID=42192 RepID=A0A6J8CSU1_MYTCO|nr:SLC17A5 [Mytilus coruscus]
MPGGKKILARGKKRLARGQRVKKRRMADSQEPTIEHNERSDIKVPCCCSQRWILAYVAYLGFLCLYAVRFNLSVAIVCMVKTETNNSSMGNDHINGTCPGTSESIEVTNQHAEFDWNKDTRANILAAFFYGYIITQIPGGWIADRFGGRRIIGSALLICGICTILTPVCARTSVILVYIVRAINGLASGVCFPAMSSVWGRWAPPLERTKLMALYYLGPPSGSVITLASSGYLCEYGFDNGWGSIFYITGGMTLLWVLLWFILTRDTPLEHPWITDAERKYISGTIPFNVENKSVHRLPSLERTLCSSNNTRYQIKHEPKYRIGKTRQALIIDSRFRFDENITFDQSKLVLLTLFDFWQTTTVNKIANEAVIKAGFITVDDEALIKFCMERMPKIQEEPQSQTYKLNVPLLSMARSLPLYACLCAENGVFSALPNLCYIVIALIAGQSADWIRTRKILSTTATRKVYQCSAFIGASLFIVAAGFTTCDQRYVTVACICLAMACSGLSRAGYAVNIVDISGKYAGIVMGITNMCGNIPGILSPIAAGKLTPNDTREEWRNVFYVCAGCNIIGALIFGSLSSGNVQHWATDEQKLTARPKTLTVTKM